MRDDMFKVIVERPRRGVGYYSTLPNEYRAAKRFKVNTYCNPDLSGIEYDVVDEFSSTKLPMRARSIGWDGKRLNENLNPLRRFIAKQVGRPWNDVYSEISAKLDTNSTVKQHVRDHLKDYVSVKTYRTEDGQLWFSGRFGPRSIDWNDFHVDENGILCDSHPPDNVKKLNYKEHRAKAEWEVKRVINGVTYEKEDGIWFRVERTEKVYMRTYYQGGGLAPIKRLDTAVSFRKWTVNKKDLKKLKLD